MVNRCICQCRPERRERDVQNSLVKKSRPENPITRCPSIICEWSSSNSCLVYQFSGCSIEVTSPLLSPRVHQEYWPLAVNITCSLSQTPRSCYWAAYLHMFFYVFWMYSRWSNDCLIWNMVSWFFFASHVRKTRTFKKKCDDKVQLI